MEDFLFLSLSFFLRPHKIVGLNLDTPKTTRFICKIGNISRSGGRITRATDRPAAEAQRIGAMLVWGGRKK